MTRLIEQNDRLIELLKAEPAKRTKKAKPFLTDEERQSLYQKWVAIFEGDMDRMDAIIAEALDHDAAKKRGNSGSWKLYVDNWFRTEVERLVKLKPKVTQIASPDSAEERGKYLTQNLPRPKRN